MSIKKLKKGAPRSSVRLTKEQKNFITLWVDEAKTAMHLQDSVITIRYKKKSDDEDCFADMYTLHHYVSGELTVYEKDFAELWDQFEGDGCKQIIFHEVAHVLISPLADINEYRFLSRDHHDTAKENLTEKISHIILDLI